MLCLRCGAKMRVVSVIDEAAAVERILRHLGVWGSRPPSQAPRPVARSRLPTAARFPTSPDEADEGPLGLEF